MPLYEYQCAECGPFAQLFSIRETSTTAECPLCLRESKKLFPVVNLREMRPENRLAWERNERSAHAPKVCGSGCSHSPPKQRSPGGDKPALQGSKRRNRRPWMLGH